MNVSGKVMALTIQGLFRKRPRQTLRFHKNATYLRKFPTFGSISGMQTVQKLSVSLDPAAMAFIDVYRQRHKAASRSQVVNFALHTLERLERERSLEAAYRLSSQDDAQLNAEFDGVAMDGLAHEAW